MESSPFSRSSYCWHLSSHQQLQLHVRRSLRRRFEAKIVTWRTVIRDPDCRSHRSDLISSLLNSLLSCWLWQPCIAHTHTWSSLSNKSKPRWWTCYKTEPGVTEQPGCIWVTQSADPLPALETTALISKYFEFGSKSERKHKYQCEWPCMMSRGVTERSKGASWLSPPDMQWPIIFSCWTSECLCVFISSVSPNYFYCDEFLLSFSSTSNRSSSSCCSSHLWPGVCTHQ